MRLRPLDLTLAVGLAACAGALAWTAPWEAALATAVVLVGSVLRLRMERWRARAVARLVALAAALSFLVGTIRASSAVRSHEHVRAAVLDARSRAAERWPARCEVAGVVARAPVMSGDALRVDVDLTHASCIDLDARITLHVPLAAAPLLARGDVVDAFADLAPNHRFWNEELGDPRPSQARRGVVLSGGAVDIVVRSRGKGIGAFVDRARAHLRARILATFPASTSPMARALVLGEDDLSTGDQRAFRRSGLAHLLAVSGMHLVLVVAGLVAAMQVVLVRITWIAARVPPIRIASALGIPCAWVYADLAGGSGSALRAAWMTSVALAAHALARRPDPWRALGLSIAGMALVDPLVAFDLSFALSAAATAGILVLSPPIAAWGGARLPAFCAPIVRALATSLAASIACAPILACMTGDLPLVGVIANVIAVPLGEVAALPLCLVHALLAPFPAAEHGCALAASGALAAVRAIAHVASSLPFATWTVPTPTKLELAVVGVATASMSPAVLGPRHRPILAALAALALVALELRARALGAPRGVLRATFLDVGQGDAAIVDLPDGRAIVVDGGGLVGSSVDVGERVLLPVLRARRRTEIAVVILSHPHPDHYGGLHRGTSATVVGELWDTGQGEDTLPSGYAELLGAMRARGVRVVRPPSLCGLHDLGAGASVEVIAPCPTADPDRGPNDNSIVARLRFGARSILFVGDAERWEERELVGRYEHDARAPLAADVLKVGHHGSRTSSSPALLAAVRPSIGVISCGVRNHFGHPAPSTLASLASGKIRVYRTDQDGAVTITTNGGDLDVTTAAE